MKAQSSRLGGDSDAELAIEEITAAAATRLLPFWKAATRLAPDIVIYETLA